MFMALQLISVTIGSSEMWKYSHANYPLLVPDVFGRVGGSFVREVIFIFDIFLAETYSCSFPSVPHLK